MKPRKLIRVGGLAVGGLMVGLLAISLNGTPEKWMKTALLEALSVTPNLAQAAPFTDGEVENASLQLARAKRPAEKKESPEMAQMKKLPPPIPRGKLRRPSRADLVNACNKEPKCRGELQVAKQGKAPKNRQPIPQGESPEQKEMKKLPKPAKGIPLGGQPRSELLLPAEGTSLLGWLNTFQVSEAYAQSGFSLYLDHF